MSRFYVLRKPASGSQEEVDGYTHAMSEEGCNVGPGPKCPRCGKALGWLNWLPPYRLELETWGRHYADVVETGNDLIVSQRLKNLFLEQRLQGLSDFEPVNIVRVIHRRKKPAEPIPRYYKSTVIRSRTTIDQAASGYVWDNPSEICPECLFATTLKRFARRIVDESTWTGDDVFFPRGGTGPLVSERFRTMFVENELRGASFIPSESDAAGYDSFPWESGQSAKA